ncbi:ABC transporter permease [Actinobacillus pleuropneumoniae]|uniref:ABC transporter permease n=1 Tax=Actinobacillus pleuropneumoniae TaxID=715 RepID=UPI0001E49E29|nr:ABC transporter permease [Actinobacillus pleuropneumoniae]EFN00173.1 ABC-2 type transporter family protein [Actinobacillus pleuropneumoniae serovar 12 str. 1096]UKH29188.1 ABC transporter permease [Actinobacillus pleuropneumoniae]
MSIFAAVRDFSESAKQHDLWRTLAWYDILGRYRRSVLGPIWITLSMAVTISAMGPLYGSLFDFDPSDFIPHLALGLIFWALMSSVINDSVHTFAESAHFMKQTYIPVPIFILRVVYRQLIVLIHNMILYPIIMLVLWRDVTLLILLSVPAVVLVTINLVFISLLISIFCARYRDMAQMVTSITSLLFFITPIIWRMEQLPVERQGFVVWNIFATYLDLMRKPLLGVMPANVEWLTVVVSAIILGVISIIVLAKTRNKITYWL